MVHTNSTPRGFFSALGRATLALGWKRSFLVLAVSLLASTAWAADNGPKPDRPRGDVQKKSRSESGAKNNGRLDRSEQAKAREAMARRRQGSGQQGLDRRELMKRFDKDGDGRLNEKERQAAINARGSASDRRPGGNATGRPGGRGEFMKRFDKNGDGKIDAKERAAVRAAYVNRRGDRPGRPNTDRPQTDRPNTDSPNRPRFGGNFLKRFDKNGDGKLDDAERRAARAAFAGRRDATGDTASFASKPDTGRVSKKGLLQKFDTDGDGKLVGKERAAARKAFENRPPKAAKKK